MPSLPVTTAPFREPYQTPMVPFGAGGLNLRDPVDQVPATQYTRATNIIRRGLGQVEARWGQTEIATSGGTLVHSIARLADPRAGTATRIWGIDTELYHGLNGALVQADTGYSGDPLTLVPWRPPQSGESWMHVADRSRMRKIRRDGLTLSLGLPAPTTVITAAVAPLAAENQTALVAFDSTDSSEAANWTPNQSTAPDVPEATDVAAGGGAGGNTVEFVVKGNPSAVEDREDYDSYWSLPRTLDLSTVGTAEATDDDQIHLWLKFNEPFAIAEARLYFVVSGVFDPATLPGTQTLINGDFYVKSFIPSDFLDMVVTESTAKESAEKEAKTKAVSAFLEDFPTPAKSESSAKRRAPATGISGAHEWVEFGIPTRPLKRGHFERVGSASGRDWSTVTGIVVLLRLKGQAKQGGIGGGAMYFGDLSITGGSGPDTADAVFTPYDYRATDFDPRTGEESNPSPIMVEADRVDTARRVVTLTPAASGNAALRQRFYRRGGSLGDNWYFLGVNAADGATFSDTLTDAAINAAGTLEIDNDQPVTTEETDGTTVKAQPLPVLIDVGDLLLGLGDPYRPGHLYWSKVGRSGSWPPQNTREVCPPSEELMSGVAYGGQAYVYSRRRLFVAYPNLSSPGQVVVTTTGGTRGLISRWAVAVGERGIYGVDAHGIHRSQGGAAEEIADDLYPLFHREATNGYNAIDMDQPTAMRLAAWDGLLFFQYQDTAGTILVAVYNERLAFWEGIWNFGTAIGTIAADPIRQGQVNRVLLGGQTDGAGYELDETGFNDSGTPIAGTVRLGMYDAGQPRHDKDWGDLVLEADTQGAEVTVTARYNNESVTGLGQIVADPTRQRFVLDPFGTTPFHGHNLSAGFTWSSGSVRPVLHRIGVSSIVTPEETSLRATQWDPLGSPDEKWVQGIMIEADTHGDALSIVVEKMLAGTVSTIATLTVTNAQRLRRHYSWTRTRADQVRLRPTGSCPFWQLYEVNWISQTEPPRIPDIDSGDEALGDQYHTGLDLVIDTFNVAKTVEVYIDGVLQTNPATGGTTFSVTANGKQLVHLTLTTGYGHVYRFVATDDNDALFYSHRWHVVPQPAAQTNWNAPYEVYGTLGDKWVKGFLLLFNSAGTDKTVSVEIDGTVVETLTVPGAGSASDASPRAVFVTLTTQQRGRVIRLIPTDTVASRLWDVQPLFDQEPLALTRWETQETNFGVPGFGSVIWGYLTIRSTDTVTVTLATTIGEDGTLSSQAKTLATTAGVKQKLPITFDAVKGLLHKFTLTSPAAFYVYRTESELWYQPWGAEDLVPIQPFGDDALDPRRVLQVGASQELQRLREALGS